VRQILAEPLCAQEFSDGVSDSYNHPKGVATAWVTRIGAGNGQSQTRRYSSAGIWSRWLRIAKPRASGWDPAHQRCEEAWCSCRELASRERGPCIVGIYGTRMEHCFTSKELRCEWRKRSSAIHTWRPRSRFTPMRAEVLKDKQWFTWNPYCSQVFPNCWSWPTGRSATRC